MGDGIRVEEPCTVFTIKDNMEVGKIELTKVPAEFVNDTVVLLEWLNKIGAKRLPPEAAHLKEMIEAGPPEEDPGQAINQEAPDKQVDNRCNSRNFPSKDNQFKPGQSGNPAGRPKKHDTFSEIARELAGATEIDITYTVGGKENHRHLTSSKSFYEGIAMAVIAKALTGDISATKELLDRTEGKPNQSIALNANITEDKPQPMSIEEMKKELETVERITGKPESDG